MRYKQKDINELISWMKKRPTSIHRLMKDFPPLCTIEFLPCDDHNCPQTGYQIDVIGWNDSGLLILNDKIQSKALPNNVKVVSFYTAKDGIWDNNWVENILK